MILILADFVPFCVLIPKFREEFSPQRFRGELPLFYRPDFLGCSNIASGYFSRTSLNFRSASSLFLKRPTRTLYVGESKSILEKRLGKSCSTFDLISLAFAKSPKPT